MSRSTSQRPRVPTRPSTRLPSRSVISRLPISHTLILDQLQNFKDDQSVGFLNDEVVKQKLATAKKLTEVSVNDYDAVLYVGGHGPVIDLASDPVNIQLASQFWQAGKIVSAVCHGPA